LSAVLARAKMKLALRFPEYTAEKQP
jgi:hypothetical protein